MIGFLRGRVIYKKDNSVIIDVSGVGYEVFVGNSCWGGVNIEDGVGWWIYTNVKENAIELFGFGSGEEMELFKLLLDVSGIGPRTALAVVDRGVGRVVEAIIERDEKFFVSVPRLGNKNAQKIIIELKGRVDGFAVNKMNSLARQVEEALLAMGYTDREAQRMLGELPRDIVDLDQAIKWCLKNK